MMNNQMMEQGSEAWRQARAGKATASRIKDLTAQTKSGWSATRYNYMTQLVIERLLGKPNENGFVSWEMQQGIDREAAARVAYEFEHNVSVETCGFFDHPRIAMSGASPDGLVGAHGLVEFKCPLPNTHYETLAGASIDGGYIKQAQWGIACTGRVWCDWCSYNPDFPHGMRLFIKRVYRDDAMIASLETEVIKFLTEVDDRVNFLRSKYQNGG
jgi:hypothetical protein